MTPSTNLLSTLESYLKLTATRGQTISANMANIDTPGYRTRDIDFEAELQRASTVAAGVAQFDGGATKLSPAAHEVSGLMERPDGNNVNIDRESLLLSQTQLQYQIGVQLVKHQFHQILSAISGGSQS